MSQKEISHSNYKDNCAPEYQCRYAHAKKLSTVLSALIIATPSLNAKFTDQQEIRESDE